MRARLQALGHWLARVAVFSILIVSFGDLVINKLPDKDFTGAIVELSFTLVVAHFGRAHFYPSWTLKSAALQCLQVLRPTPVMSSFSRRDAAAGNRRQRRYGESTRVTRRRLDQPYKEAKKHYLDGDLDRAAALAANIVARSKVGDRIKIALARELQACIEKDRGNEQDALERLLEAEQLLLRAIPQEADLLGRVQYQIGVALTDLGGTDSARLDYFVKARDTLFNTRRYAELRDAANELVTEQAEPDWRKRKRKAERELERVEAEIDRQKGGPRRFLRGADDRGEGLYWRMIRLIAGIALLDIEHGTDDEAEHACIHLKSAALAFHGDDPPAFFDAIAPITYAMHRPAVDLSRMLPELLDTAFRVAHKSGAPEHLARAHYLRAMSFMKAHEDEMALADALACVSLSEMSIARSDSIMYRAATRAMMEERRHLALSLCCSAGRPREAAELIERSRLQALPFDADGLTDFPDDRTATEDNALSLVLRATTQRLGRVSGVFVEGSSVRDLDPYAPPREESVDLGRAIDAVGGVDAWWWGTWIGLEEVFAVTRSPSGEWAATQTALSVEASAASNEIERLYHRQGELTEDELITSAIFSPTEEHRLMALLGDAMIPRALRDGIGTAREVLSVVVAGNVLSTMPLPALVVPGIPSRRLVEVAVLRVQPPAALVEIIEARPVAYATSWPLQVAIVDPSGDLRNACHLDLPARRILSHSTNLREGDCVLPASIAQVVIELSSPDLSSVGTIFYSGHVDEDPLRATVALCLMDDELPSTRLFREAAPGRPWRLSDRVVISACGSAGSCGTGGGEWLGFAAGLLFAGARHIVATAWPIPDWPATFRFDERLVHVSVNHPDLASGLREVQLEWLKEWLTADVSIEWTPLLWSSFQCIGVRW